MQDDGTSASKTMLKASAVNCAMLPWSSICFGSAKIGTIPKKGMVITMKTLKRILNADVLFSAAVLVVCVVFYSMASALSHTGGSGSVDAGMFPRLIAVVTAIFASIQIYHGIRDQKGYFTVTEKEKPNQKLFFMTIALVALYIAAWNIVPFIPRTLLLLVALCKLMRLSWKFTILYSAILSCGLYYIFANVFRILL